MTFVIGRSKKRLFRASQNQLPVSVLMVVAAFLLLVDMIVSASLLSFGALLLGVTGTAVLIWKDELSGLFKWVGVVNRRYKLPSIVFVLVAALFLLDCMARPASAQFFQGAQTWMAGQFPQAAEVIPLVFNVLRGLFLVYLGISLVKVVQAARNDEDWQTLARTPLIIVIAVTVAEVLTGLIIGGSGATP